jgi:hypothetical protein
VLDPPVVPDSTPRPVPNPTPTPTPVPTPTPTPTPPRSARCPRSLIVSNLGSSQPQRLIPAAGLLRLRAQQGQRGIGYPDPSKVSVKVADRPGGRRLNADAQVGREADHQQREQSCHHDGEPLLGRIASQPVIVSTGFWSRDCPQWSSEEAVQRNHSQATPGRVPVELRSRNVKCIIAGSVTR